MQNSIVGFAFLDLDLIYLFWRKFNSKNQNCQFKLKFGTKTNLNMQKSMVCSLFTAFDLKQLFWVNLAQKTKIASLS